MKLAISILVITVFVALAGAPHAKSDPMYEVKLPAAKTPAVAQKAAPTTVAVAATTPAPTTPVFDANNPATWPKCADNQVVWAQDGACHDKPVATPVASAPRATTSLAAPIYDCTGEDNLHGMQYVFCHESGSIPNRPNAEGCVGLGQACPASKLYAVCPTLDVDCQISYFSSYAAARYGGWSGAEAFWRINRWW